MTENASNAKTQSKFEIEQKFLKVTKDPDLGVYCELFSARSRFEGQDGGVVSALLAQGFEKGLFDAAIVVRGTEGYGAEAVVAKNASDVLAAKGTRYLRVNMAAKLRKLINEGVKRIAVVCTPCQAKAARAIQSALKDSGSKVMVVGLFCFEAFNPAKLKEEVKARLGVDIGKAEKTEVRQGKFTAFVDGKEYSCRVKDLDCAAEKGCRFCDDFTSRLADVSVGSVGSKKGYSTVIVRSKVGDELVKNLEATREAADKEEIDKLSKFKRNRAKQSLAELNSHR